jgi:hypothetical protein
MYSVWSAAELKPDVVVVVEAVAVRLDEADPDEVADAAVAKVNVRPLSTGLLLLWIATTEENDRGGDAAPAADPAVPNPRGGNARNQFGRNAHG